MKKFVKENLFIIIAIIIIIGLVVYYYWTKPKAEPIEQVPEEKTIEQEIIESLTAPPGAAEPISDDVLNSLTAPE